VRQEHEIGADRRVARDDGVRDAHATSTMTEGARASLPPVHSFAGHYMLLGGDLGL
jgi:hypothetical protein